MSGVLPPPLLLEARVEVLWEVLREVHAEAQPQELSEAEERDSEEWEVQLG